MKRAVADKDAHVGDPAFVEVPVERLLSKNYAIAVARRDPRGPCASASTGWASVSRRTPRMWR